MGKEFELINLITEKFSANEFVVVGPGDDAAVIDINSSLLAISTDMAVENVHFKRNWLTTHELGRRIVAQNFADIVAMSATPIAITASVSAPQDTETNWFEELALGMQAECNQVGASVLGGDLSTSQEITISVTALGLLKNPPVLRSGAKPGQVVAIAGTLGYSAAGLKCLETGHTSPKKYVENFRVPKPPYQAGIQAGAARAMIDISDGLLSDALHIAQSSRVQVHLKSDALLPEQALRDLAFALSHDAQDWILNGGEEHSLLAVFDEGARMPEGFRPIGRTLEGEPGVFLDGIRREPQGFTHF